MEQKNKKYGTLIIWSIISFVILIILIALFKWNRIIDFHSSVDTAHLSYFFSIISSVVTIATLYFVYKTFLAQKKQLDESILENKERKKQESRERFENNFFKLLENHHRIIDAMDLALKKNPSQVVARKRDCFKRIYFRFHNVAKRYNIVQIADTIKLYDSIQNNYKGDLHHYFRFVYHVLKYISKEDLLSEEEKYYYSTIYRAMFSPYELVLIFYNCLHPFGKDDFRPLIIEFSFFNNLDKSLLIDKSHYDNDYPKQAYERK